MLVDDCFRNFREETREGDCWSFGVMREVLAGAEKAEFYNKETMQNPDQTFGHILRLYMLT